MVNEYTRVVRTQGNVAAQALISEVFFPAAVPWRGIGCVKQSGLVLSARYADLDVERRLPLPRHPAHVARGCLCGAILRGAATPDACPLFGRRCTPERPLGAPMVSAEGACAAYFHYRGVELPLLKSGG